MKKIFTISVLWAISLALLAQTQVEGNQSGTWTVENSPYQVIGELTVPNGETLIIEAGVEVNFQGYYKFTVQGNLQAIGTESDSIFFTTDNISVGWGGIRFDNTSLVNNMSYCRIEFGRTSGEYPDIHGGGMALMASDAIVSHCVFADNDATGEDNGMGGAVYCINTGSPSKFMNCKFIRNHAYGEGGAVKLTGDYGIEFFDCRFLENDCNYGGGAISLYSVDGTVMNFCLFANNYTMYASGGAIHTLGIGNAFSLNNCTLASNNAVTGDGGGIYLVNGTAAIINTIIYDNDGMYSDNLFIGFGGAADVNYCNTNFPDGASGSNNINENPMFQDANNQNFQLQETSACIDAGTDIGYEFYGIAPDMGCYEFGIPTFIDEQEKNESFAFPNPATDVLRLENTSLAKAYTIVDITGKTVLEKQFNGQHNTTIDVSALKEGVYFLRVSLQNNHIKVQRFVKL